MQLILRPILSAVLFLGVLGTANAADIRGTRGVLMGLDKVSGKTAKISITVGEQIAFESLTLSLKACYKRPPNETPESSAFLEITETGAKGSDVPRKVFNGWMFASSPSLSAMDHELYDVWVIECL